MSKYPLRQDDNTDKKTICIRTSIEALQNPRILHPHPITPTCECTHIYQQYGILFIPH